MIEEGSRLFSASNVSIALSSYRHNRQGLGRPSLINDANSLYLSLARPQNVLGISGTRPLLPCLSRANPSPYWTQASFLGSTILDAAYLDGGSLWAREKNPCSVVARNIFLETV